MSALGRFEPFGHQAEFGQKLPVASMDLNTHYSERETSIRENVRHRTAAHQPQESPKGVTKRCTEDNKKVDPIQ